jgi:hypothetical protein
MHIQIFTALYRSENENGYYRFFTTNGTHAPVFNLRLQSINLLLSYSNYRSAGAEMSQFQTSQIPNVAIPKVAIPKVAIPNVAIPKVANPNAAMPNVAITSVAIPRVAIPNVAKPNEIIRIIPVTT